ncbi:hypothetical protein [Frondihabitans cladoniiphilus]
MTRVDERVTVWVSEQGVPQRLVWRAERFRVTDTPTRLSPTFPGWQVEAAFDVAITHPPTPTEAWRFQGTSETGDTLVFDVSRDPWGQQWRLLRTYA